MKKRYTTSGDFVISCLQLGLLQVINEGQGFKAGYGVARLPFSRDLLIIVPLLPNHSLASYNFDWRTKEYHTKKRVVQQGHQVLSGKSDENKSFKSNQLAPSIYIMIELCFFSLDQWEIRIHLLWEKCFKIPHNCDPHLNQTKFNDLLPLTIAGVLATKHVIWSW